MAVTFQSVDKGTSFASGLPVTVTVPAPSGIVDGNLLVCVATVKSNTTTSVSITGFTERLFFEHSFTEPTVALLTKVASSESGSYVVTFNGAASSSPRAGIMLRIDGQDPDETSAFHRSGTGEISDSSDPRDVIAPVIITTVDQCMILHVAVERNGANAATDFTSSGAHTEIADFQATGSTMTQAVYRDNSNASIGAQDTPTLSGTGSGVNPSRLIGVSFAIAPAVEAALSAAGSFAQYSNVNFTQSPYHVFKQNKFLSEEFRRFRLGSG